MVSLAPIVRIQVADKPGISWPVVFRLSGSTGCGPVGVGLIEEPVESLDGSDSDDSLSDCGNYHEGVSDLALGRTPGPY